MTEAIRSTKGRERLARVLRGAGEIISVDDTAAALGIDRTTASKLLARWVEQGWLKRLKRGLYSQIPLNARTAERTLQNPWLLVPELFAPGYVGGWSAAEHWDLTEQIFREVCVFTTRVFRNKRTVFEGIGFVLNRTREQNLFGLSTEWQGSVRISVSDPHRTILDMLDRPTSGGGIRHVASCLQEYLRSDLADPQKLLLYADRLGNGAVYKRLGFLMERTKAPDTATLDTCLERMSAGYAKLDPALPADLTQTRWRLRLPAAWENFELD